MRTPFAGVGRVLRPSTSDCGIFTASFPGRMNAALATSGMDEELQGRIRNGLEVAIGAKVMGNLSRVTTEVEVVYKLLGTELDNRAG